MQVIICGGKDSSFCLLLGVQILYKKCPTAIFAVLAITRWQTYIVWAQMHQICP